MKDIKIYKMSIPELRKYCEENPTNLEAKSYLEDRELYEAIFQLLYD